jgi:hypothetical protein
MDRRSALKGLLPALGLGLLPRRLGAEEAVAVPIPLQIELLVKVAAYDRNLPTRARGVVRTVVLLKRDHAQSKVVAEQALRALAGRSVAGLPAESALHAFSDGAGLAERVRGGRASILYAAPGFGDRELLTIARSLSGLSVLSSAAVADFVRMAVAVGFDLVSGKPKLLVNVRRAREQGVDLSSQVLKLARVLD